jgi:hypothetical protein
MNFNFVGENTPLNVGCDVVFLNGTNLCVNFLQVIDKLFYFLTESSTDDMIH